MRTLGKASTLDIVSAVVGVQVRGIHRKGSELRHDGRMAEHLGLSEEVSDREIECILGSRIQRMI